jgi:hypothetical protein
MTKTAVFPRNVSTERYQGNNGFGIIRKDTYFPFNLINNNLGKARVNLPPQ